MCAAAVILPLGCEIPGLNDSKKLTEKKREALFDVIREKALAYGIGWGTVEEIDRVNILQATFLAMGRAVEALGVPADYALIDGNRMPPLPIPGETIVKGDAKSASVAAASILAKVSRDGSCASWTKRTRSTALANTRATAPRPTTRPSRPMGCCRSTAGAF